MQHQAAPVAVELRPQPRFWVRTLVSFGRFLRKKPLGAIGLVIVLAALFLAIAGPAVAPQDPWVMNKEAMLKAPSVQHWFGTDFVGRDVFSRTLHGTRVSMYVGFSAILVAGVFGLMLGVAGPYFGGAFDLITQRFVDLLIALPNLILALALVAALGESINNVVLALAIVQLPRVTRVVRSSALSIKEIPYIDAAKAIGASGLRIMVRHIVPNTFAPLIIVSTASIGSVIIVESSLSFLGVGVPARVISWGALLGGDTRKFVAASPWIALGPGLALTLAVFGLNMLGDALRDVLDPKLRGR